jgi:NADPH:quinone reductase-like Zn-dependent oxidoreductase
MRRLEITGYGPIAESVRAAEAAQPLIAESEVLIRVEAASINPIDTKLVRGFLRRIMTLELPAAFGFDACGTVEAVGRQVTDFAIGDRVFVRAPRQKMGSFADFLAVEARFVAKAPRTMSTTEAASIPLVALTTVQGLVDRAHARPGQHILIHAGSGGLGSFAVQYARHVLGLHVSTTTSSRNVEWVRALGAQHVIAYDREDYRESDERYDIVFDTLGGTTTTDSFGLLKRGGTVISVAGPPDRWFARQIGAGPIKSLILRAVALPMAWRAWRSGTHYYRYLTESDGGQLAAIAEAIDAGKVHAVIDSVFPFARAIDALQHLDAGHAKGKVVITMGAEAEDDSAA